MKSIWQTLSTPARMLGIVFLLTPVASLVAQTGQQVTPASCDDTCCGKGGNNCSSSCCCDVVCCPKRVTKEVKKHCWLVEPKYVCIPGFHFPWERYRASDPNCGDGCDCASASCAPVCGRVRCVNTLEKHEYQCEKCGYEWNVKCVRPSNQCGSCSDCDCPSCGQKSACDL